MVSVLRSWRRMSELSSPCCPAGLFSTKVSGPLRETLDDLVAGENSIARKLQTSRKYQMVLNRAQKQHRKEVGRPEVGGPDQEEISASVFAKDICNFSFNDARFDSRCRPLLRIFALLPVAIETLSLLSGPEGDFQDRVWASAPRANLAQQTDSLGPSGSVLIRSWTSPVAGRRCSTSGAGRRATTG